MYLEGERVGVGMCLVIPEKSGFCTLKTQQKDCLVCKVRQNQIN
jgi:hypothetical protein